ncbi:MAG: methylated-DNA--[protein]-cysteine S-methyltransferase [Myxococcaceae bacterium]
MFTKLMKSPLGELILAANERALIGIYFKTSPLTPLHQVERGEILKLAEQQLGEYFAGKRKEFNLPLEFNGTDFQKKVWTALLEIPYGQTKSYADIAKQVGSPKAVRAVGLANSKNPISIIAACHRVIGSNGKLTGYAGGLHNKEYLLRLEHAQVA